MDPKVPTGVLYDGGAGGCLENPNVLRTISVFSNVLSETQRFVVT